jgi:NAD(P)-dependent dehydrogenase (short-subunit alcohol dehydrogenase family)
MKRTVIIIGATGGIGEVLYDQYLRESLVNKDIDHVIGTSRKLPACLDITNPKDCDDFVDMTMVLSSNLQIINCAGINYNATISKSQDNKWWEVVEVNLLGSYNLLKAFTPIMKEQKYGRFMFMSSVAVNGLYGASAYSASKAGLEGLVKSAAKELLKYNITVNSLRLGYFNTGLIRDVPKGKVEELSTAGEICAPTGLFDVIEGVFKCKDMTGSIINVDRGI